MLKKKVYKIIALIPARSGSQRIKNKNIVNLHGKPLIGYSVISAKKSLIFDKIFVSTNSKNYAFIAKKFGAEVPFLRPNDISGAESSDYEWVNFTLKKLKKMGENFTHFFILRPTSPFRSHKTIRRAWKIFTNYKGAESLRAIELCKQHPAKIWRLKNNIILPLFKKKKFGQPMHNLQYKSLPKYYIQNASLEISRVSVLDKYKTITGKKIIPFFTKGIEGFDINHPTDLELAKKIKKSEQN